MKVALAKTCFWREDGRDELADISGRQAILWVDRDRDGEESFEGTFHQRLAWNSTTISVVKDRELAAVAAALNRRLDELEAAGAVPVEGDEEPRRVDLAAATDGLPSTHAFLEREVARYKELPPPTPEVDPAIVQELLRVTFTVLTKGKHSDDQLDAALTDAADAIRSLPCDGCGGIHWPVVAEPTWGSAAWWDDPCPYFACRTCRRYLASAFAYPYIRKANDNYPVEGVLPRDDKAEGARQIDGAGGRLTPHEQPSRRLQRPVQLPRRTDRGRRARRRRPTRGLSADRSRNDPRLRRLRHRSRAGRDHRARGRRVRQRPRRPQPGREAGPPLRGRGGHRRAAEPRARHLHPDRGQREDPDPRELRRAGPLGRPPAPRALHPLPADGRPADAQAEEQACPDERRGRPRGPRRPGRGVA